MRHVYEHMENRSVAQASAAITTTCSRVCVLDLLSASVYPVHQLVSTLTLLIQVHLQLIDPLLQTPTQAATCDGLGLILCKAPDKKSPAFWLWNGSYSITYLHDFNVPGFVFFGVGSTLRLQLQFLDLLLQHLLLDHGLVSLPLRPPQVFILMHQLAEETTRTDLKGLYGPWAH